MKEIEVWPGQNIMAIFGNAHHHFHSSDEPITFRHNELRVVKMTEEAYISSFALMQLYGNYLLTCGYNTYDEIMNMTATEMRERFLDITTGDK